MTMLYGRSAVGRLIALGHCEGFGVARNKPLDHLKLCANCLLDKLIIKVNRDRVYALLPDV